MDLTKALRSVIAAGIGLGLGLGAACVVHDGSVPPQHPQPAPATAGQPAAQPTSAAMPDGWYYCHFRQQGTDYKRYYCRVYRSAQGQHIQKVGGFEIFAGNLAANGQGVSLAGRSACNQMGTNCRGTFNVRLANAGGQVFRGQVEKPGWWLHNSTLTLQYISSQAPHGAMGGAGYGGHAYGGNQYGGAHYGGAHYGGAHYGGAHYGGRR